MTDDGAGGVVVCRRVRDDELSTEPLVESLGQVVAHVLVDDVTEVPFAKEDEVVEVG